MKWAQTILIFSLICCNTLGVSAQITVDDTKTAQQLVEKLISSTCVTATNFSVSGDNFSAGRNSYGEFSKNGSSFPFEDGIVLSTWSSINSKGPFIRNSDKGSSSWLGDPDLNKALNITSSTNATSLEFDFTPLTSFLSFNYVFASNEYQDDFPCLYSDGFAFLIKVKGTNDDYQNLAVIPGTTTPVSSTNIHQAISFTDTRGIVKSCPAINENFFGSSNTAATNTSPINYAGQTVVMNAQMNVIVGTTYRIKLVISDAVSGDYDSAVFLQAGSFAPKIDLGVDRTIAANNPVCYGESYTIDTGLPASTTCKWYKDGSLIPISGETKPTLNVTSSGTYKVEVPLSATCSATGVIKIEYAPEIILQNTILSKCDDTGTGIATFDLTEAETAIKNSNSSITRVDFYETRTGTVLSNVISDPSSFVKTLATDQIVYAMTTSLYGCNNYAELTIQTRPSSLSSVPSSNPIINAFSGSENSVELIPPTTTEVYEYSLDGVNYQVSPLFKGLLSGIYNAYIRNISNCQYLTYPIIILDYPRFFTPNGDGLNDVWQIKNLDLFPKSTITIFNRYGKLIKELQENDPSWDGDNNGNKLQTDDYWFQLDFGDGNKIKGHFSLKR
jgi:gliding motility-associated-like protein